MKRIATLILVLVFIATLSVGCASKGPSVGLTKFVNPLTGNERVAWQMDSEHGLVKSLTHPNLTGMGFMDEEDNITPIGTGSASSGLEVVSNSVKAVFFPFGIDVHGGDRTVVSNSNSAAAAGGGGGGGAGAAATPTSGAGASAPGGAGGTASTP